MVTWLVPWRATRDALAVMATLTGLPSRQKRLPLADHADVDTPNGSAGGGGEGWGEAVVDV